MPAVYRTTILAEAATYPHHADIRASWPPEWVEFLGAGPPRTFRTPSYRVLAESTLTSEFAGQLALVTLAEKIIGIADWFTVPTHHHCGVAVGLAAATIAWADRRAVTLLVDTGDPGLRRVCARHGFTPVTSRDAVELTTSAGPVLLANLMARGPVAGLTLTTKF